jgi:hypothetical protein
MINENNYDMWIGIFFCYAPIIVFLILAFIASKSGSIYQRQKKGAAKGVIEWIKSDVNVPIYKQGFFYFAIVWLVLGSIFFWGFLYPDHHDIWFTPVK